MIHNILIKETGGRTRAIIESDGIVISEVQDALDLMAECDYRGADAIVLQKEQLPAEFFDLRTGLAGEVLQKFSNYRKQLAIVGDFSGVISKSLRDFIRESNRSGRISFVSSLEEAEQKYGNK